MSYLPGHNLAAVMDAAAACSVIRHYTAAELRAQPQLMAALAASSLCSGGALVYGASSDNDVYWVVQSKEGGPICAMAAGWLGGAAGTLTIRTLCWQMDSVGTGVLRRLYDAIVTYARRARLATVDMYTSTSSALRDFAVSMGMTPKPGALTVYTARATATPGVKSAIKPFVSAPPLTYASDTLHVKVYNQARVAAKRARLMSGVINRHYAVNLLDTFAPVPPGASMYVLKDKGAFKAPGYAVARARSDGSCAVTALFARDLACVNTLLRFIASRCGGVVELHGSTLTVAPRVLLDGAWKARARVPGVLRWEAAAGSAHEKKTPTPSPRRVSLSHAVQVFDAMPHALARFVQGKDAVQPPEEAQTYALNRSERPMVDAGGAVRAVGGCNRLAVYEADALDAHPAIVAALRESALCQGNPYLAEAVDGLLGLGIAAVSSRTTRSAMYWVLTSAEGVSAEAASAETTTARTEVCAVVVTRVVTPRTEPLRYSKKRMEAEQWARYGSRLQAATLQLEYICWREGVAVETLRDLLAQLVAGARAWACARIWTQLRPEEAAQIAFLTGEGFVPQAGQIYVLQL